MQTTTQTATYTVVDIRKTFGNFQADLSMIARRTGKMTPEKVDKICHDVLVMAEGRYLHCVDITLVGAQGTPIQASRYTVNSDGNALTGDRPGNNDWPDIAGSELTVLVHHNDTWLLLDAYKKQAVREQQFLSWGGTTLDTSYSHLQQATAQGYANKGYELNKVNFN
jgi:hypothetical protein